MHQRQSLGSRLRRALIGTTSLALVVCAGLAAQAPGEQSSQPGAAAAAELDSGYNFNCAILDGGAVRCWGAGTFGALGYGNTDDIGDTETPASVGPVDLGAGRTAVALSSGARHTCAILDTGDVRCWGRNNYGQLGYSNTEDIGDTETPGSVGPVDLGSGRTAVAISAGQEHTCAILDNGAVRCWGRGGFGRLGYGNLDTIGDTETPASVGPVSLGGSATAISLGDLHSCAVLVGGTVRCWGYGGDGALGYGDEEHIGDTEAPSTVGPVDVGGLLVTALTAGGVHTCAVFADASVGCWGYPGDGQLGYGNFDSIGDDEAPAMAGTVNVGSGRTALAIGSGQYHSCAILDTSALRCWGEGEDGQLGYANTDSIGDTETPDSVGTINVGAGRTVAAVSGGTGHTCARLDNGSVRCWGDASFGQLGYGNETDIGDTETPDAAGPVDLGSSPEPPTAVADSATVDEGAPATPIDVLANDPDPGGGGKAIVAVTQPAHGTTVITGSGGGLTYRPDAGYCGSDSFTYTLNGGSTATVTITVTCVDDDPPETTITKKPKDKSSKRKAKFKFVSSEANSTFECKLDKKAFKPCTSPKVYKVKPGKHKFQVRATDSSGNTDATPAKDKFKVTR